MGAVRYQESIYPADEVVLITPDDDVTIDPPLRAISVGTAGNLAVSMNLQPTKVVIPQGALAVGIQHPARITKVWATGTTASNLVGWR